MRLERLFLRNWCKAHSRDIVFEPGMNALLGPNGSGKSNTLNAVVFALTGDYSRNAGTKAENIHQLDAKGPASVRLVFTHNNMRFDVTRGLRDVTTVMTVSDLNGVQIEAVRAESKVTKRLTELLRVNVDILSGYVFVGQGKMFEPFDTAITPAARMVAFQQLFGLDRLEALWVALGEQLAGLPIIVIPDMQPYLDEAMQAGQAVQSAAQALAALEDMRNWVYAGDPDKQLIDEAHATASLTAVITQTQGRHASAVANFAATRHDYQTATLQAVTLTTGLLAVTADLPRAKQILDAAAAAAATADACTQAIARAAAVQSEHAAHMALRPTELPAGSLTAENLRSRILALDLAIAVDNDQLMRMGTGSTCPTCGQAIGEAILAQLEQAASRIADNTLALENSRRHLAVRDGFDLRMAAWVAASERLSAAVGEASQRAAEASARLLALNADQSQVAWAVLQQETASTLQRAYDQVCGRLRPLQNSLKQQRDQIRISRTHLRQIQARVNAAPSAAAVAAAELRLATTMARSREYAAACETHGLTACRHKNAEAQLARCNELVLMATQGQAVRKTLEDLRAVLHRDNLPKALLQQRLVSIGRDTNTALELFGAPFRLTPREDRLSYRGVFFDGCEQPIERLSGGEKVLVALAFRIAVNARFASDLGLLCLDEPTVYLDADNVRCLEPALARLRQHAQATGLQCVLITHEDVGQLFDHVITCP
jgi:energy-coupling factor transporter ATP-binding protein EcfA2